MSRTNFAPTARTIIVALVLVVVGLLGTYGTVVPDLVGVIALIGAGALLLLGMVVRGISAAAQATAERSPASLRYVISAWATTWSML